MTGIGGVSFPKLGAHPLLLHTELAPEYEEDEDENDKPAHLGEGDRGAKEPSQDAGVDWVTDLGIWPGADQLVSLLDCDGAAPIAAQVLSRPDREKKAGDHDGSSQPERPKPNRPDLKIEPAQRNAYRREQDNRDQEDDDAQDTGGYRLDTSVGFRVDGFDLPVDGERDPENWKETFVEPEHTGCYAAAPRGVPEGDLRESQLLVPIFVCTTRGAAKNSP